MAAKKMTAKKKPNRKKKGARGAGKTVPRKGAAEQGMDNQQVRKAVVSHCTLIASKGAERKKINADITASRNALVARGLNRAALNVVEKCARMEPQHAEGFAMTLLLGLKAIDQPLTPDLFLGDPEADPPQVAAPIPEDQVPAGGMH